MSHQNQIARLESQVDYLETELEQLNYLLTKVGFTEGITTLKETIESIFNEQAPFE